MRQSVRLFTSFAAGALVALPGLALADGLVPVDVSPADVAPIEPSPSPTTPTATADVQDEPVPEDPTSAPDAEASDVDDLEVRRTDDDPAADSGHGPVVSALAGCLPSGRDLHGTGLTKGHVMRQAASTREVVLQDDDAALPVTSVKEAQAVCTAVQGLADGAEVPDRAVGRPDGVGPKDRGPDDVRRGPPDHANGLGAR